MKLALLFALTSLTGCAHLEYTMTVTATSAARAKPPTCDFRVVSMVPSGDFVEIATLTRKPVEGFGLADDDVMDPVAFKQKIRADVCRVGGDLVVAEINGAGSYIRGTVLVAH